MRCLGDVGMLFVVGSNVVVMRGWVMFCDTIIHVFVSREPFHNGVFVFDLIKDPEVTHFHLFGALLFDGLVGNANSGSVVNVDRNWGHLWSRASRIATNSFPILVF